MSPHAWRRLHGHVITAEVLSDGRGAWRAKVFLTSNPTASLRNDVTFCQLVCPKINPLSAGGRMSHSSR